MNRPSTRSARVIAAAGVVSAVSMLGLGTAASASAATASIASPTVSTTAATSKLANVSLQTSLSKVVWHPPYGCIVCGLGGFDPGTFGDPINPATLGTIGF